MNEVKSFFFSLLFLLQINYHNNKERKQGWSWLDHDTIQNYKIWKELTFLHLHKIYKMKEKNYDLKHILSLWSVRFVDILLIIMSYYSIVSTFLFYFVIFRFILLYANCENSNAANCMLSNKNNKNNKKKTKFPGSRSSYCSCYTYIEK
jgi:cell division protein FtsW (lipid II flippase)